ncbi:GIY-YIG nuclease family protein [Candidatus Berkelbacteria bacterium]|nr:GIY-YIG nuclease family protein [Candidatus Berkelbacteria bacterium]
MHYVYILKLENGQYYTGYSSDLKTRVARHYQSSTVTTKRIKPDELVFYCAFDSKARALGFERYLKSSSGKAFRNKRLIAVEVSS